MAKKKRQKKGRKKEKINKDNDNATIWQTRKHTAKHGGPSTIIGKVSKKGKGPHKVVYKNTWYNRIRRLKKEWR